MTDTDRRLRELEDEVRYLRRRLDDAIARPPVWPAVYPSMPVRPWTEPTLTNKHREELRGLVSRAMQASQ